MVVVAKVIMSGVNGNVIMSGYRDDNPDDERREAARDNTKNVSRELTVVEAGVVIGVSERQCSGSKLG